MTDDASLLGRADGDAVYLTRSLAAGVPTTWLALTEAHRLSAWLGRLVGVLDGPGSRVELWHDETVRSVHSVLRWEPQRALGLTWEFPDEPVSRLTLELRPDGGTGSVLDLRHDDLQDPAEYAAGWHRHLDFLAAHLAGRDLDLDEFWSGYDELVAQYRSGPADDFGRSGRSPLHPSS